ncbi:AraC family transcriptional regulator [Marinobacterium sediminicola]|uniref:AraC-type DNA-binding protein n=1 Tax=Marinobacterium sediminicola TaxID=518898 RepID=A0ABY1RYS5_9GAMM|nr:AraC family transcriptional regulator [Marinobacterium sediminicola]ULG68011.1 AraC family transcriptional regulator [Marinobacterium sediminicola]SMR73479.1 AraC-type DNA-binding protein [Marinobacterium sediminicola]
MRNDRHSVSTHFARTMIAAAKRHHLDHDTLLQDAGLTEQLINTPGLRITPEQLSRLTQGIWRQADDEFLCMGSRPSRHGVFALMAKQVVRCRTLRPVLYNMSRFYNLVGDAFRLEFRVEENTASFSLTLIEPDKDPDFTLREFMLLLLHRFPSWLIGQKIPLRYVTLDFPAPAHREEHRLMYPCEVLYRQPTNSFVFDADLLNAPVVQTSHTLRAYLRSLPLDWFKRQAYYSVYTRRVMDYLESSDDLAAACMEVVSAELHMTSRTLRRKLTDEGTSFQELKDGVRRDTAIHLLSQSSLPISQISRRLGFSEPAAFTRAFKQWTGVSPSLYRQA